MDYDLETSLSKQPTCFSQASCQEFVWAESEELSAGCNNPSLHWGQYNLVKSPSRSH